MTLPRHPGRGARGNGRALPVHVFRSPLGDCTNNGISARSDKLLVVGDTVEGFIDLADVGFGYEGVPVARLVRGNMPGAAKIVPADAKGAASAEWCMFGGNYAGCSDDRWCRAVEQVMGAAFVSLAPIHDRIER